MSEKVKETVREEIERVSTQAQDAARSGAYIYPLRGVFYFISHRDLWGPLMSKLTPMITTAVGVTTAMFAITYIPQAAVLTIFNGPLAVVTTILLVLSESATVANLVSRTMFLEDALIDTFDGTLVSRNMTTLVSSQREIRPGGNPMAKLGRLASKPFAKFTPKALIRYVMYLPLNFIPVVGTVLFIILQGSKFGPNAHARYFQLKKMSSVEKEEWIHRRKAAYTSFGIAAMLFELIPVVGIFFAFTNQVGAALWAADLEAKETTAPGLREKAKKAE